MGSPHTWHRRVFVPTLPPSPAPTDLRLSSPLSTPCFTCCGCPPLTVLSLHAATYAGGKEEEAATMALMQSGAVDAVAGALTASIMNERVVQHDLQAVVPFVTREADRAVTPRWVQLSAQCPGARTW